MITAPNGLRQLRCEAEQSQMHAVLGVRCSSDKTKTSLLISGAALLYLDSVAGLDRLRQLLLIQLVPAKFELRRS